jgi:NAD(P)-dependent dehydrogenase (short-subunit alcohol dehydrogenase family)
MLKDNVIIIAGGAGLIGQEFVKTIVQNNGIAIIADLDENASIKILKKIKKENIIKNIDYFKLDISSKESINKLICYVSEKYGKIDSFINCAYPRNKNYGKKFEDVEYEDFCINLNLHIGGYFLSCQQILKFYKNQGYGNIINVASIYGVIAPKFEIYENAGFTSPVEYAAIKSAIIHLTKYMAKYFKGCNIRINCISPGGIRDKQNEEFLEKYQLNCLTKGMLDKDDLNGTLLFLLSNMSKFINGQNLIVDDGFTL